MTGNWIGSAAIAAALIGQSTPASPQQQPATTFRSGADVVTVEASVRKTGRLVITHEAGQSGGLGAEVAASITER